MSPARSRMDTMRERYDQALEYGHDKQLPPDTPYPKPTNDWPPENVALLERYGDWLAGGGASEAVIRTIYIPMAGHVLGLFLKPHAQLDLDQDLEPGYAFVVAKGGGADLAQELPQCPGSLPPLPPERARPARAQAQAVRCHASRRKACLTGSSLNWNATSTSSSATGARPGWRRTSAASGAATCGCGVSCASSAAVKEIPDLRRVYLYDYADYRLEVGNAVTTINADLRDFHGFMAFLQEQGYAIPQSLLRVHGLKPPDRLPQFLSDEQVRLIRDDFERQVVEAKFASKQREALLIRAAFYLLWQGGLRKGEVEELRLEDLDLAGRKLTVRQSKGLKDRTVFLTDTVVKALTDYLALRGVGPTDHVFLYRNQPLNKDLVHGRLKLAGEKIGVNLHAHRLRHTCATQLLNAGCPVTSIQKFLGHKKLNTTMIYARVHDKTVEEDYFAAMARVEQRLKLPGTPGVPAEPVNPEQREQLLGVAQKLEEPELGYAARLELATVIRVLLGGGPAPLLLEKSERPLAQAPP